MTHYNLALLGFGNVGRALARLLQRKEAELQSRYDITFSVTGIATGRHGTAIDPAGLDYIRAAGLVEAGESLARAFENIRPGQVSISCAVVEQMCCSRIRL